MKHGKKLTRKQKEILVENGYDFNEWLLERQTELDFAYVHRDTKEILILEKN